MVDVLSVVFRRFSSQHCESRNTEVSSLESGALVVGDENINRSLLLLSALTAASELAARVLFFTQNQIESVPATFQSSRRSECLKKIRFVYPKTLEELLEDVASLHQLCVSEAGALPSLLIVDGLEQYVCGSAAQDMTPQEAQSRVAHVVALLHDTAAFLTQSMKARAENQSQCRFIISFQSEWKGQGGCDILARNPLLSVLERYLQVRCASEKARKGEGLNEWLLYLSGSGLQVNGDVNTEEQLQWHVVLQPNGALEFCHVSPAKEDGHTTGAKPHGSER